MESAAERTGVVHFAGGHRFDTSLHGAELLGALPAQDKAPFLVLAGFGCTDCDINRSLYIHSPSDGPAAGESQPRFVYPGTLVEWDTPAPDGEILRRARAFVGTCLESAEPVVLWVTEAGPAQEPGRTLAEIARVEADTLRLDTLPHPQRVLAAAEGAVRGGRCREIPPLEQLREP
jgi:hypothetical protein